MTEAEQIQIAQLRCDTIKEGVSMLLLAVFGQEHDYVLAIAPTDHPNEAGCIIGHVDSTEQGDAILRSALERNQHDNALDLGETQTKQ